MSTSVFSRSQRRGSVWRLFCSESSQFLFWLIKYGHLTNWPLWHYEQKVIFQLLFDMKSVYFKILRYFLTEYIAPNLLIRVHYFFFSSEISMIKTSMSVEKHDKLNVVTIKHKLCTCDFLFVLLWNNSFRNTGGLFKFFLNKCWVYYNQ